MVLTWKKIITLGSVIACLGAGAVYWHYERNKDVLAWVGELPITKAEFAKEMRYRGGNFIQQLDKKALLDEMIQQKLMLNKAYAMGIPQRPDVQREYDYLLMGKVRAELVEKARENITVSDEDLTRYYQEHKQNYLVPQKDRFAILFLKKRNKQSLDEKERSAEKLNSILELAKVNQLPSAEEGFGEYAISYSEHQVSRYKGGEIGWFKQGDDVYWEQSVLNAGFKLQQVGDVSPVVETDKGFYLVRLMAREAATQRPFAEVKEQVRHKVILAKQDTINTQFQQRLLAEFDVSINQDRFDQVTIESQFASDSRRLLPASGLIKN